MTLYRNRETGIIQFHPKAGLGDVFNSDEVGENGKPFVKLPVTSDKIKKAKSLMSDNGSAATPAVEVGTPQEGVL